MSSKAPHNRGRNTPDGAQPRQILACITHPELERYPPLLPRVVQTPYLGIGIRSTTGCQFLATLGRDNRYSTSRLNPARRDRREAKCRSAVVSQPPATPNARKLVIERLRGPMRGISICCRLKPPPPDPDRSSLSDEAAESDQRIIHASRGHRCRLC